MQKGENEALIEQLAGKMIEEERIRFRPGKLAGVMDKLIKI